MKKLILFLLCLCIGIVTVDAQVVIKPPTKTQATPKSSTHKTAPKQSKATVVKPQQKPVGPKTPSAARINTAPAPSKPAEAQSSSYAPAPSKPESSSYAPAPRINTAPIANKTFYVNGVSFTMIGVQGGTFRMGATSEQVDPSKDEKPVHQVSLSSYMIGETEVTQALWEAVMGSNPSYFKGSNLPVEQVSWYDCQDFIARLNQMTNSNFRLPTEAEWEYAARGGNRSRGTQYSGAYSLDNCGWYSDNSSSKTHPVKTKQANELGIYDMSGNVWEWCQDWYGSYSSSAQTNPKGPNSGSRRVHRGGSWFSFAGYCRSAYRNYFPPGDRNHDLGVRLALSE